MASLRSLLKSEDWMSLWIGLLIFALSLGLLAGADILGWAVKTNVWVSLDQALQPVSDGYSGLGGGPSLVLTFLFLLVLMSVAARGLEANVPRFMKGFTVIFFVSYINKSRIKTGHDFTNLAQVNITYSKTRIRCFLVQFNQGFVFKKCNINS